MVEYFKDAKSKYLYLLLETDGRTRQRGLGVREEHYDSKELADAWYTHIRFVIGESNKEAISKLNSIHKRMIEHHEE